MPKFFNRDMAGLAHQLTISPRRLRTAQLRGIENLLSLVERDKAYPYDFVCYHITKYRKRGLFTGVAVPGKALIADLVTMADLLSRKANLTVAELGETYQTHSEVAAKLSVSTKTIRRWRSRGLLGLRVTFADGVNRLAFPAGTVKRFVEKNKALVEKGAAFTQLTSAERNRLVQRAQELVGLRPLKLHAAAKIVAQESGRAVETVRYTLRRFDEAHPDQALFNGKRRHGLCERYEAISRLHEAGETNQACAAAYQTTVDEIERVLRCVQLYKWKQLSWDHIHDELFDAPQADALILEIPEAPASDAPLSKPPKDLPLYLKSLYATPLFTREQERDLFRRYSYLKCKVGRALKGLDAEAMTAAEYLRVAGLITQVEAVKQRIIKANLRLVVSIAKRHVGWSPDFFAVISDGNMSLMRAVENFDYNRGVKFSTYATWAVMKNYARSIPEERYHSARYVTGQDEVLEVAADRPTDETSESDQHKVRELIQTGLGELDEREREIVSSHFGLGGKNGSLTLEQLGQRFGVTKERIRQIEQRALSRLRELLSPRLSEVLAD